MKYGGLILLWGSVLVALCLLAAPDMTVWGKRHTAHERPQRLVLHSETTIGQTFAMEEDSLSGIAVWIDPAKPFPREEEMILDVTVGDASSHALYALENIPPSGIAVFHFNQPIVARKGAEGIYTLGLSGSAQSLTLQFEIDEAKYPEGRLIYPYNERKGDLAFQFAYDRPALGSDEAQALYAVLIVLCGVLLWQGLKRYPGTNIFPGLQDILWSAGVGIATAIFYGFHLLQKGYWLGPTDFTKDAAYLASAAASLKAWAWPIWEHVICGGMPLMGSIEGNALSIGTLFALIFDSQKALMLMNTLEAGIAAAGMYALARSISSSRWGSVLSACVYALSPWYLFKIVIGYSMIGAVFAYAPWILLCFLLALRYRSGFYAALCGFLIGLTVLRGEAHIIVVLIFLLIVWSAYDALRRRTYTPVLLLAMACCMAFFVSSIKVLPYMESLPEEPIKLYPYVAPLIRNNLFYEVLFTVSSHHENVPVLHGRYGEAWGVFGSYVGIVPALLAAAGLLMRKRYRTILLILLLVSLVFAEGTLFEYALRFLRPLDALLRMPVRNMMLVVLCVALLAGRGLDYLSRLVPSSLIRYILQITILLVVIVDLGRAGNLVAREVTQHLLRQEISSVSSPVFENYAVGGDGSKNANVLLARGYLLPQVCADQNRTISFIKNIDFRTPFASVPATLAPHAIILDVPAGTRDIGVRERFHSLWTSSDAAILEETDGSLYVIPSDTMGGRISLFYGSPTKRAQQAILYTLVLYLTVGVIYEKVKRCFHEEKG